MNVENQVQPDPEQIALFVKTEGPVCMVNLLKFKERAEYADGRTTDLTGYEAYSLYATQMRKLVEASGALFPRARGRFKGGCAATPRTQRSDAVLQRAVGRGV